VGAVGAETHRWTSRCVAFEVRAAEMVASRGCSRSARCEVKRAISQRSSVMIRPTEQNEISRFLAPSRVDASCFRGSRVQ
jgi:hypothetical protein